MQKRNKRPRPARLGFEQLEGRYALAGIVTVDISGTTMKVTGDNAENDISIFLDANNNNQLTIVGNNGTAIVGDQIPDGFAPASLVINMKKALIPLDPPDVRGTLGVDRVQITDVELAGKGLLSIKGDNGGVVDIDGVFARKTLIDFDKGNGLRDVVNGIPLGCLIEIDDSFLGNKGGPSSPFAGGVSIFTKDCRDHVEVNDSALEGNVVIKTKGAVDEIGLFNLQGGISSFGGMKNLTIDTGKGDDVFAASGLDVNGKSSFKSGDGNDKVFVGGFDSNTFVGKITIDTGKGDDVIGIGTNVNAGGFTTFQSKITLKAGSENDKLMIGNRVTPPAVKPSIDGGKHTVADTVESTIPATPDNGFKNWEAAPGFIPQNLLDLMNDVFASF